MKIYTETINNCTECPAYNKDCCCDKAFGTYVEDSWKFPVWCPLEDVV